MRTQNAHITSLSARNTLAPLLRVLKSTCAQCILINIIATAIVVAFPIERIWYLKKCICGSTHPWWCRLVDDYWRKHFLNLPPFWYFLHRDITSHKFEIYLILSLLHWPRIRKGASFMWNSMSSLWRNVYLILNFAFRAYFWRWWNDGNVTDAQRATFRQIYQNGQLEFVIGLLLCRYYVIIRRNTLF